MSTKIKRSHRDRREISLHTTNISHPLNVKPLGNALLSDNETSKSLRKKSMGYFSLLPDEIIMQIISYIRDLESLKNLSHTSRVMYAYLYDEEIWRRQYVTMNLNLDDLKAEEDIIKWTGSWRSSLLGIDSKIQANIRLPDDLLFSDLIYRSFQCSQINYEVLFENIIDEEKYYRMKSLDVTTHEQQKEFLDNLNGGRILRVPESLMSPEDFNNIYHDKPFILTSQNGRWPEWTFESLAKRFDDVRFRQESVNWPLKLYLEYLKMNKDESPLYLFDCASDAVKILRTEYKVPEIFSNDFFRVFQSKEVQCRPDYAWLIVGPKRSGSTFHKDPNYTSAWNTAISGRKLWVMFPPDIVPPGVGTDGEESEVTSPVGIAEWIIAGFFNDSLKIKECLIGVTFPGECIYVPAGWWHTVINIDDSIAITQNFVPAPKLKSTLSFFKHKPNQVSGFKLRNVMNAIELVLRTPNPAAEDLSKLKQFLTAVRDLNLADDLQLEDCGEIELLNLPQMPLYDFFKQLLLLEPDTDTAFKVINELEREEDMKSKKFSKSWNTLVKSKTESPESESTFSFGFSYDSE